MKKIGEVSTKTQNMTVGLTLEIMNTQEKKSPELAAKQARLLKILADNLVDKDSSDSRTQGVSQTRFPTGS